MREITENRSYLQSLTQQEVAHFAYPFGSMLACAEREAALVAAGGFRTAATARPGCVFPGHEEERYALPREGVQWHDDEASLACKSIGARRFLRDLKLGRPWRAPMATMARHRGATADAKAIGAKRPDPQLELRRRVRPGVVEAMVAAASI